ncbi:phosphatase PAP2 family protein [Lactobacillus psittaci]|nr:phosphatase PAP2 family protein [Lactobacillus psittaci]
MNLFWLIELCSSAIILLFLIYKLQTSKSFRHLDGILKKRLTRPINGTFWSIIEFLNAPKLIAFWDTLLAIFLFFNGSIKKGIWVLCTLAFTDLVGIFLKHTVKRKRPSENKRPSYSFPSGHVLSITSLSLIIWQIYGGMIGISLFFILFTLWCLVVFSRIMLKAHYPSDIVGATILSIFCFLLAQPFFS